MSKVVAIIQARMGSTRLPGKVLMDIEGKSMLARVIERAGAIPGVDRVVLATTTAESDAPLVAVAEAEGAYCFRGSPEDVLDRYYQAARQVEATTVMRITADCPLLDPQVSGAVLARFQEGDVDYASNIHPPTYPDGLDTEVFSVESLERAWREAKLKSEREHVTPYVWKQPDKFRMANVSNTVDLSPLRWTVDEARDMEFARSVYSRLQRPGVLFGYEEVVALVERHPTLGEVNTGIDRNEGYTKSLAEDGLAE